MKIRMKKGIGGILLALIMITSIAAVIPMAAGGFADNGGSGTGTPGYWKNHPDQWPTTILYIGTVENGCTFYREEAIDYMKSPEKGNKVLTMFRALVAAKLNNAINDDTCDDDIRKAADSWMATYGLADNCRLTFVKANSDAWQNGDEDLYELLDDYNNYGCDALP